MYSAVVTITGDGVTTSFATSHGLTGSNFGGFAQANTYASRVSFPGISHVDADSTHVTVHFFTAPDSAASQNFNISAFTY